MMANNNILEYTELKRLSILDYYQFIEMVSRNISKMNADGQGKNSL